MPIHNVGYRNWTGDLTRNSLRWTVIAETGVRLAWKSQWLRRMLFFAWLPAAVFGVLFFLYEQMTQREQLTPARRGIQVALQRSLEQSTEQWGLKENDRHDTWALLLFWFFRYPQGLIMTLLVGMVTPALISQDMRSRAFLLYFSRPISPLEYILGKATVVWLFLSLIITLPALTLYVLGVMLSPDLDVLRYTWDLPLRILAASLVVMVPTTALALLISSIPQESRYAGFAWFAIVALGWVAYGTLSANSSLDWTVLSLYHTLGRVQTWVFGLEADFGRVSASVFLLSLLTVLSIFVLNQRVSAQVRA